MSCEVRGARSLYVGLFGQTYNDLAVDRNGKVFPTLQMFLSFNMSY